MQAQATVVTQGGLTPTAARHRRRSDLADRDFAAACVLKPRSGSDGQAGETTAQEPCLRGGGSATPIPSARPRAALCDRSVAPRSQELVERTEASPGTPEAAHKAGGSGLASVGPRGIVRASG